MSRKATLQEFLADKIVKDAWRLRRVPQLQAALHKHQQDKEALAELERRAKSLRKVTKEPKPAATDFLPDYPPSYVEKVIIEDPKSLR